MNSLDALRADTWRQYGRYNWRLTVRGAISVRTFRAIVVFRLCQLAEGWHSPLRIARPVLKALHRMCTHAAAIDLPWRTAVGEGLAIAHGRGLVVSGGAHIGRNVTLFHGVTIGRRDRVGSDGSRVIEYPVLEDEVWVGPHAIIVGGVRVGRGSRIAGGAFVTESVPPYSVVSGNPARVVSGRCIPDVLHPAPFKSMPDG